MSNPSDSDKPQSDKPQIEVVSDEDWKDQVKAEDAKLDAAQDERQQPEESAAAAAGDEIDEADFPPATFTTLVQMFATQAFAAMGMLPGPDGKPSKDLRIAKHLIDLLGVLEKKTEGQLTEEEGQLLEQALHELRMIYVSASSSGQQPSS
ncbi:hypothetical protein KOR42_11220 [Thalassoglobus neptunius]|uniref:DUF1844 domain-containing protein n=1 Tax=Thalassoglobus neptunius TaxID=1938619 RepID=A0A5C5X444_9PLAN|nr:DUF1844 domain-containing protein [Thalassoglobus neptunius]TWT57756.1 hypothetical protein KOR42_11220 [Thalassoglobus neptunius]